jgi:hypothetical protein
MYWSGSLATIDHPTTLTAQAMVSIHQRKRQVPLA